MKARRIAILGGALAMTAGAVAVACSFPELTFATSEAGTNPTPTPEAGPGVDASKPTDVDPEGADAEAGIVDAGVVDASNCCDCDSDDWLASAADASCGTASPKGDCDDAVNAIHPDAGFASNDAWPSSHQPRFDWNCDGTVTKQLNHSLTCPSGALGCSGEGFQDDPECGQVSNYFTCVVANVVGCVMSSAGTRQQACR